MTYTPKRVFHIHLALIAALALVEAAVIMLGYFGHRRLFGLSELFNPGLEKSLPNYFSMFALFTVGLSAWALRNKFPSSVERRGWTAFAVLFFLMGLDEGLQIHEMISEPFGFAGTLIYAVLAIPFGLLMFGFWLRQPTSTRVGILGAGMLYILAAVMMELIELSLVRVMGLSYGSMRVELNVAIEEFGEMIAVALYLRVFLARYAMLGGGPLLPEIRGQEPATPAPNKVFV